ncbi:MAG: HPr family phosphocarrier protein [Rhodospirillaceae bacterium]|jgi:phosphocarrier protein|nr:HPr family phosphocarrier protein [Rhodospirillaceae bacterium]MBT3810515.1 HPr family phosphocarrier protein [Rhodospirillaceae bacterium]MBT3929484.1 HPr family phosphocarrier protein [Rhodospirillaceae bacterium]MBT4772966.1 HPr family phosphocarrier protein [Rhodospirillaceae bacterium]MBT5359347.1 HPr family phosphocarrier protein [Rhodospirillaceae bacterium]
MTTDPLSRSVEITNTRGLHARAAARFVRLAETFDADIIVEKGGAVVPGTSIMGLMMLAAAPGSQIQVRTSGAEAREALDALVALVSEGFGEE